MYVCTLYTWPKKEEVVGGCRGPGVIFLPSVSQFLFTPIFQWHFIIGKITYLVLSKMTYFPLFCAFTLNARGFDAFFHFFFNKLSRVSIGILKTKQNKTLQNITKAVLTLFIKKIPFFAIKYSFEIVPIWKTQGMNTHDPTIKTEQQ